MRGLAADGSAAERKALRVVICRVCPNVILLVRDMAHAVRIAAKGPLQRGSEFELVWEDMFNRKGALVPEFQHSDKLKAAIQASQRDAVKLPGLCRSRSALDVVLKHFSFAKQRFDSFSLPAAKVAIMLLPVGAVLAARASDVREKLENRRRAMQVLRMLTPKCCLAFGVDSRFRHHRPSVCPCMGSSSP